MTSALSLSQNYQFCCRQQPKLRKFIVVLFFLSLIFADDSIKPLNPAGDNPKFEAPILQTLAQVRVSHVQLLLFERFTMIEHIGKTLIFARFH